MCRRRLATDDIYTVDEVAEMLASLESMVRVEIESELIFAARTNVLLVCQILQQAEAQNASVGVDVFKLEDRCANELACFPDLFIMQMYLLTWITLC